MPLYCVTKGGKHLNVFDDFSLVTNHICYSHTSFRESFNVFKYKESGFFCTLGTCDVCFVDQRSKISSF